MLATRRFIALTGLVLAATVLAGCGSMTSLTTKYRDPDVRKLDFQKVAAMAIHNDGPQRRLAEAEMVNQMGPDAVAASKIIPEDARGDMNKVRAALTEAGVDGAVTIRLLGSRVEVKEQRDPVPTQYMKLWDYYGFTYAAVTEPTYLTEQTTLDVEVNVYSLTENKLLWSGVAHTERPTLVETVVRDVAETVTRELRRERLLPRR